MQEYFNATASCGSAHRNATSLAAVEKGIKDGIFSWHAKPFTAIHELADPELYAWSLGIAKRLNTQFGVSHGPLSPNPSLLGPRSVRRPLLTLPVNPGSLYRCGKSD